MKKLKLSVNCYELKIIIKALNELKIKQLNDSKPTEAVYEFLLKS